jgi:hypothetical protein
MVSGVGCIGLPLLRIGMFCLTTISLYTTIVVGHVAEHPHYTGGDASISAREVTGGAG